MRDSWRWFCDKELNRFDYLLYIQLNVRFGFAGILHFGGALAQEKSVSLWEKMIWC